MKFTIEIPDPAAMRVGREAYATLPAGSELHRVHSRFFGATEFNNTDRGNARFSPIRNPAGDIIPTIYAGQSFECATCEIILRCPDAPPSSLAAGPPPLHIVFPADFRDYSHSTLRTRAELKLIDLTVGGQRKLGVNHNALLAGPKSTYPATRSWATRIHAAFPAAQGVFYGSVQAGPQFAIMLFGDRVGADALEEVSTRLIRDKACHDEIAELARSLSIEYADV